MSLAALATSAALGCYSRGTDQTVDPLPQADGEPAPRHVFGTAVHLPFAELGATTPEHRPDGSRARIPCATCHGEDSDLTSSGQRTGSIHTGIALRHGDLTCDSCHRPPAYSDFRSIRKASIAYPRVIELCSQCHGAQRRDYDHGAHGGMAGYWDLNRGPRDRNHCLVCHDPHRPAIPKVMPAPLPRYRFTPTREESSGE